MTILRKMTAQQITKGFVLCSALLIVSCAQETKREASVALNVEAVSFKNVTEQVGLITQETWKYGGPTVADFNNDGWYDIVLGNHHEVPSFLYLYDAQENNAQGKFVKVEEPVAQHDVHGIAAGDYDTDGDQDVLVSLGGGNGAAPQPARLQKNTFNGEAISFEDVTEIAKIHELGSRGRSVRWLDLDSDGDLDFLHITARPIAETGTPRNIVFENLGNGEFVYRKSPAIEDLEAERVLLSDVNNDGKLDLITFTPLNILLASEPFQFVIASNSWLPKNLYETDFITAAAEADIDNDGDMDIYLSRGKTYYQIANNSISFDPKNARLDIRDEGNKSEDGITFFAKGDIVLDKFFRWYRSVDKDMPLYLGAHNKRLPMPETQLVVSKSMAKGTPKKQDTGWYLGYLGNDQWRLEWVLRENYAWDVRASIWGIHEVKPDWTPQNLDVPDILLLNQGSFFTDASDTLPKMSRSNSWGVVTGDFNNDSYHDFFVYQFGELSQRRPDILLLNHGKGFIATENHGATVLNTEAHGDMGSAFDFNQDGAIDILSGDDDQGKWYLFENNKTDNNDYLLVDVKHNANKTGPQNALVKVVTKNGIFTKRIGSSGSVHSQSNLSLVHFGLGKNNPIEYIEVTYRDGIVETLNAVTSNQKVRIGALVE